MYQHKIRPLREDAWAFEELCWLYPSFLVAGEARVGGLQTVSSLCLGNNSCKPLTHMEKNKQGTSMETQQNHPDFDLFYRAVCSRDARFDGLFFTAVTSTGIYCRLICPARTPQPKNVRFYLQTRPQMVCCIGAPGAPGFGALHDIIRVSSDSPPFECLL